MSDDRFREPLLREVDLSTAVPLPHNRPLTFQEQAKLWTEHVPELLRRGRWPDPSCGKNWQEDAMDLVDLGRRWVAEWGWLMNRLDWDREYLRGVRPAMRDAALEAYDVPDCCQPGHRRVHPSALAKLRHGWMDGTDYNSGKQFERAAKEIGRIE